MISIAKNSQSNTLDRLHSEYTNKKTFLILEKYTKFGFVTKTFFDNKQNSNTCSFYLANIIFPSIFLNLVQNGRDKTSNQTVNT